MFPREISSKRRVQTGGFAYQAVKNQTMSSITNHMITVEPGEQSVVVVIVVPHAGHTPVTGSMQVLAPIIIIDGCAVVTTTAHRERESLENWAIAFRITAQDHMCSVHSIVDCAGAGW